jgi:hypothetical protein
MTTAIEQLLSRRDAADRFATPPDELLALQLEAVNERLSAQIDMIPLLRNRAETSAITKVVEPADLVPLLFAHSTYKTYSEAWLLDGQWDRMARWLQTVSTYDATVAPSFDGVTGLDDWVTALESQGRFVACSSGTTGKPAMLGATEADLDFAARSQVAAMSWATGIEPVNDMKFLGLGPRTSITKNERIREALVEAFASPTEELYQLPIPVITSGALMAMILLRRKIADGTAFASEVAELERLSAQRTTGLEAATADAIDVLVEHRDKKLLITGMYQSLYPLAVGVRERGYGGDDFRDDNALLTGGGLKGAQLPADFREFIFDTFGLTDRRAFQFYSMQELNTVFPRCSANRYHVAPWVVALPLDATGEQLLDASEGEVEARAAFVDLALEGRWGGVITGDRVSIDFRRCACGCEGPTIGMDIERYADLEGGDKITCAGTIDAYVRGAS